MLGNLDILVPINIRSYSSLEIFVLSGNFLFLQAWATYDFEGIWFYLLHGLEHLIILMTLLFNQIR